MAVRTFEGRLHSGLDEPGQQLEGLGILRQSAGKGAEGFGVPAETLQGHALAVVGLEREGTWSLEVRLRPR